MDASLHKYGHKIHGIGAFAFWYVPDSLHTGLQGTQTLLLFTKTYTFHNCVERMLTRMRGLRKRARAMHSSCRWPALRFPPASATTESRPPCTRMASLLLQSEGACSCRALHCPCFLSFLQVECIHIDIGPGWVGLEHPQTLYGQMTIVDGHEQTDKRERMPSCSCSICWLSGE